MKNLKLFARKTEKRTVINVCGVDIGRDFTVIAGPCSVESETQLLNTALTFDFPPQNEVREKIK